MRVPFPDGLLLLEAAITHMLCNCLCTLQGRSKAFLTTLSLLILQLLVCVEAGVGVYVSCQCVATTAAGQT